MILKDVSGEINEFGTGYYNILYLELLQSSYKLPLMVTSGVCILIYVGMKLVCLHEYAPSSERICIKPRCVHLT
jgi:hypothetical protein